MSLAFVYTWPVWIHSFSFCPQLSLERRKERRQHPPQPPPKWHLTHSSFMLFIHPWPLISRSPVFTNNNSSPIAWIATQLKITPGLACLHSDFWPLQSTIVHFKLIHPSTQCMLKSTQATGLHSDICPLHSCPKCPTAKRPERIPAKTAPVRDY